MEVLGECQPNTEPGDISASDPCTDTIHQSWQGVQAAFCSTIKSGPQRHVYLSEF